MHGYSAIVREMNNLEATKLSKEDEGEDLLSSCHDQLNLTLPKPDLAFPKSYSISLRLNTRRLLLLYYLAINKSSSN